MGKILPDLDLRLARLQADYQDHYGNGDYRTAAQFLFQLNSNLPADCKITDLPKPSIRQNEYMEELTGEEQFRDYCDEFAPDIFSAIALFNEKMITILARNTGMIS